MTGNLSALLVAAAAAAAATNDRSIARAPPSSFHSAAIGFRSVSERRGLPSGSASGAYGRPDERRGAGFVVGVKTNILIMSMCKNSGST